MKKSALSLAILALTPLAHSQTPHAIIARTTHAGGGTTTATPTDKSRNGFFSLRQSDSGSDVIPAPQNGVDTLEYAAGALSLVHDTGSPVAVATISSTVAKALSLAKTPRACPHGEALNAMDAAGNALVCVPVAGMISLAPTPVPLPLPVAVLPYSYVQLAIQAGDVVGDQNTSFATHATIPADSLVVGSVIMMDASGTYDINAMQETAQGVVWLHIGGNKVAASNFQTHLVMGKNYVWTAHAEAIVRSLGTSGTLDPLFTVSSSANPYGGRAEITYFNPTHTVDTTTAVPVEIEFIGGSPTDSATLRQMTVTVR